MTEDEFTKEEEKILERLPVQFRAAVSYRAYEMGHAYGWDEVLLHLQELVEMLVEPIKEFQKSCKS